MFALTSPGQLLLSTLLGPAAGVLLVAGADLVAQEAPAAPPPRANAATIYRQAIEQLVTALTREDGDEFDLDFELAASELPAPGCYRVAPWPELVEKTAVARTLFAQATQVVDCRFDGTVEPPATELHDAVHRLGQLSQLVCADAWQRVDREPAAVLQLADQLLDHALHVGEDLAVVALLRRLATEKQAIELLLAAVERLPDDPSSKLSLERALQQLQSHVTARDDHRGVADRMQASARFLLQHAFGELRRTCADAGALAVLREAEAQVLADVAAAVASLRGVTPPDQERVAEQFARMTKGWEAELAGLELEQALRSGVARPLAAATCLIYAPNTPEVYRLHLQATAALEVGRKSLLARLQARR